MKRISGMKKSLLAILHKSYFLIESTYVIIHNYYHFDRNDESGFNNFDMQQTTEDQFRAQQNNDFPRDDDFNRQQQQFNNDFRNNEVDSDYPYSNNNNYGSTFYDDR